jgi:hypothetical protein
MQNKMVEGDLVFLGNECVAQAAQSVEFTGPELVFQWMPGLAVTAHPIHSEDEGGRGWLRPIFNRGGVRHWEVSLHGNTEDGIWMGRMFAPYRPGPDPAGMVVALDLVLGQTHEGETMTREYLSAMRAYFAHRAKAAA